MFKKHLRGKKKEAPKSIVKAPQMDRITLSVPFLRTD